MCLSEYKCLQQVLMNVECGTPVHYMRKLDNELQKCEKQLKLYKKHMKFLDADLWLKEQLQKVVHDDIDQGTSHEVDACECEAESDTEECVCNDIGLACNK